MNGMLARGAGVLMCALPALAANAHEAYRFDALAPGVYVHTGVHEEPTPANRGDIANKGAVVGDRCVAVIDTGGSLADGQALLAAIRGVTTLPVCYVINTHMHPDHVFGNAAFDTLEPRPVFIADSRLPPALAQRASTYLARLGGQLGAAAQGERLVPPDRVVEDTMELDLGGRSLMLHSWPTAHTNNDLTVFDAAGGVLWLGDLLFRERIPALDGSLRGWLAVSRTLRTVPAKIAVPGHGPPGEGWRAALDLQDAYLQQVADRVKKAIAAGRSLSETVQTVDPAEASTWRLAPDYHTRNVTAAFAELEWE